MSIASEITRLQNAKNDLKASINLKTDNEHQITDETIDEYADFVDSIIGGVSPQPILPNDYQEVEYIESNGNQYINSNYYPKGYSQFEFEFENGTNAGVIFGSYNTTWTNGFGYYHNSPSNTATDWCHYFDNTDTGVVSTSNAVKVVMDKGDVYINDVLKITRTEQTFTLNNPAYIFAGNTNGSITQRTKMRLKYFKIKENDVLIKSFVPCYNKTNNQIGLYEVVNNVFYTNSGSGSFTKGSDVQHDIILQNKAVTITENTTTEITADRGYDGLNKVEVTTQVGGVSPRLPSEYQEVEYIQSSGTQYIDTGLDMSAGGKIDMQFKFESLSGGYYNVYGTQIGSSPWKTLAARTNYNSLEIYAYETGYNNSVDTTDTYTLIHEFKNRVSSITLNENTYSSTGNTDITTNSLYLFANNNNNHVDRFSYITLNYCKIYDENDNLIRDYVPCYNKNTNVIGLYDLANDEFCENDGTGVFAKGSDVEPPQPYQEKTITITDNTTTIVVPDSGFDGISKITIITNVNN